MARAAHLVVDVWGLIQTAIGRASQCSRRPKRATKAFGSAFTAFKDVAVGAINAIKGPLDAVGRSGRSGAIDRVKSLIDALGRIKVPSIHLPSIASVAERR